jgi:putative salt-induced outer membrane protein YdiY
MRGVVIFLVLVASTLLSPVAMAQAQAQQTPAPMKLYTGNFGGGLALTSGNTDTKNYNLTFSLTRDPKTKNVFKTEALYLRGTESDVLNLERAAVKVRDEYSLTKKVFLFAEFDYLRDPFKDIRYLLAPIGGVGYKFIDTDSTKLAISGGAGGLWEKNSDVPVKKSGSVNAGQTFFQKLSTDTTLTESVATLWKTNDFDDSLTSFRAGLTTTLYKNLELKVEFLDTYKSKPPSITIKKNDTAFIMTFLLKY